MKRNESTLLLLHQSVLI